MFYFCHSFFTYSTNCLIAGYLAHLSLMPYLFKAFRQFQYFRLTQLTHHTSNLHPVTLPTPRYHTPPLAHYTSSNHNTLPLFFCIRFTYLKEGAGLPSGKKVFTVKGWYTGTTMGKLGISRGSNVLTSKSSKSAKKQKIVSIKLTIQF